VTARFVGPFRAVIFFARSTREENRTIVRVSAAACCARLPTFFSFFVLFIVDCCAMIAYIYK